MLTHFSLFSGIGGIDLSAEWAGFTTVGQCEIADYPYEVLCKHWPDVPKWRDIHDVTNESVRAAGIKRIDLLSGGFPCQPFSIAGKQHGEKDDRHLWPEMLRVIDELKPSWVIGENVENAVRMVLDEIIDSLEGIGYKATPFVISAYCSGAWYDGRRIFIVATPHDRSPVVWGNTQFQSNEEVNGCRKNYRLRAKKLNPGERWQEQSRPFGVADGVPYRVDRISCLGNAVNPYQIYPILKAIHDIEEAEQCQP